MPTVKNNSNFAYMVGNDLLRPGETKPIQGYPNPSLVRDGHLIIVDVNPKVGGLAVDSREVSDEMYDIPYADGMLAVSIEAITDITFKEADSEVVIPVKSGDAWVIPSVRWKDIGKITVSGTAQVTVERLGV